MVSITELEKKLEELPLLPAVIVRLLALDPNDENYFEELLELAQEDPTFALRLIRLSNSATSSPVNAVTTLQNAVVRLGVKSVAGLVTSMATMRVFIPTSDGEKALWSHSLQVAVGARLIAKAAPQLKVDPEQAFLCGLLHDIGRFVLFDKAADEMNLVEQASWETPTQLIDVELAQYGFNHSDLGGRVCKKWGLPDSITHVVAEHHKFNGSKSSTNDPTANKLTHLVQMADAFSLLTMLGADIEESDAKTLEEELHKKCVKPLGSSAPISAKQLHALSKNIIEESNNMSLGLGVAPSVKKLT